MIIPPAISPHAFDATRFRADTPGADSIIHLNAAGAGLPPRVVTETVIAHLRREAERGPHWAAAEARESLVAVRDSAATLLGCAARNIAFGESAGRLWAMALLARDLAPRSRVLVARSEWVGNVLNLIRRKADVSVEEMPVDAAGRIDVEQTESVIDDRVAAICLPLVASSTGVRQPVAEIAALPRPDACLLFVDAAQAVGQIPAGLAETGADVLVTPARKWLRGPRGTAMMALSDRALALLGDPPLLDQAGAPWVASDAYATREDAARFETYEYSVAGRLGLGAAIDHALGHGVANIRTAIADRLRQAHAGLSAIPGVTVFEDIAGDPAFLTYRREGRDPAALNQLLADAGIAAATVGLDYARRDLEARGLAMVNRLAPHAYTSAAEIDAFLAVVGAPVTG